MAASKVCHDPRRPLKAVGRVDTVESGRGGIPHLAKNERDTRISCTRYQATATCAAFVEESRMKFINANKLRRKSGGMGHPSFAGGPESRSAALQLKSQISKSR